MRPITKIAAAKEEPKPLTVGDMKPRSIFRIKEWNHWYIRTEDDDYPVVSLHTGVLGLATNVDFREVTEVLADGDSLTIGPEVKDGSAKDV